MAAGKYVMIIFIYLVLMTGIFYILFLNREKGKVKGNNIDMRSYIMKKAAVSVSQAAEKIGLIFYRHKANKEPTIRRRVLEILENEKDIQITPPAFLGYKMIIAMMLAVSGILLGGGLYRPVFAVLGLGAGYFIPDILIYWYSKRITDDIERELPYVIDLLRISALSGQNIYNSFKIVSRKYSGRISGSLDDFIKCIDMGMGKEYAYKNLMLTSRSKQFREFVSLLFEADSYGSSIEDILSRRSVQVNHCNWDNAERKAKKKGLLTLIPLTCLILPAFILLVGGPLVYSMAEGLLF